MGRASGEGDLRLAPTSEAEGPRQLSFCRIRWIEELAAWAALLDDRWCSAVRHRDASTTQGESEVEVAL